MKYSKKEISQAVIDYVQTVIDCEGVDFIDCIKPKMSQEIIQEIIDNNIPNDFCDISVKHFKTVTTVKTFEKCAAQGDVLFVKIDALPPHLIEQAPKGNELIITHSETGHNHVMVLDEPRDPAVRMYNSDNPLMSWLEVNRPTSLDHKRTNHTHESIMFQPGIYEIRRQQESAPKGWRQVHD